MRLSRRQCEDERTRSNKAFAAQVDPKQTETLEEPGLLRSGNNPLRQSVVVDVWISGFISHIIGLREWESSNERYEFEQKSYEMPPREGISIAQFLTVADIERSARYYEKVFGARILSLGDGNAPGYLQLANIWMILNVGGGPTPDKPTVTLSVPDPKSHQQFLEFPRRGHSSVLSTMEKSGGPSSSRSRFPKYGGFAATSAILTVISSRSDRAQTSNTVNARHAKAFL